MVFGYIHFLAALGIAVTVASFFGASNWIADLFSQFKFQWAVGLGALMLLAALARRWWLVLFCFVGFAINGYAVWPYLQYSMASESSAQADHLSEPIENTDDAGGNLGATNEVLAPPFRLMTLNVLTSNRDWDAVVELVKSESPDFLVLMEVDSTWEHMLREGLQVDYPHSKYVSRLDNFGIAFLSMHSWSNLNVFDSHTLQLPSIDVTFDGLGTAKSLRIIATHPIPPMSERNWNARNEQLFHVANRFDSSTANIMTGDFNLSPWSPNFPRLLAQGGLVDPSQEIGGSGLAPTWYVFPTWLGGLKLDHTLISPAIEPKGLRIGADVGSDHRAVIFDFQ